MGGVIFDSVNESSLLSKLSELHQKFKIEKSKFPKYPLEKSAYQIENFQEILTKITKGNNLNFKERFKSQKFDQLLDFKLNTREKKNVSDMKIHDDLKKNIKKNHEHIDKHLQEFSNNFSKSIGNKFKSEKDINPENFNKILNENFKNFQNGYKSDKNVRKEEMQVLDALFLGLSLEPNFLANNFTIFSKSIFLDFKEESEKRVESLFGTNTWWDRFIEVLEVALPIVLVIATAIILIATAPLIVAAAAGTAGGLSCNLYRSS